MIRKLAPLALGISLLLAGCGDGSDHVVTQIKYVDRPVPTSCVPANTPAAPAYPDSDDVLKAAPDAATRELLLYAGRKVRAPRATLLEGIVAGCR